MGVKIDRKKYQIDATDKILGRLATEIAVLLRGKNKVNFIPHIDNGDFVEVVNADKIKVTGKKMTDKIYYRHSGYIGGIKAATLGKMMEKDPTKVLRIAVYGMLPKNKTRDVMIKRLSFR